MELQTYREESQHYRQELETVKQDMAVVQEQLRHQAEAAQHGPSAITQNLVTILRAQLQDKEAKEQLLTQTVTDLQVCPQCFLTNFISVFFKSIWYSEWCLLGCYAVWLL
jgi:hypothetical protein